MFPQLFCQFIQDHITGGWIYDKLFKTIPELLNDCVKSVQIRTRKNSVFGHSSRSELDKNSMKRIKNWLAETRFLLVFLIMLQDHVVLLKSEICFSLYFTTLTIAFELVLSYCSLMKHLHTYPSFFLNHRNLPAGIYLQSQQWKHQDKLWNLNKVNNTDTRTM